MRGIIEKRHWSHCMVGVHPSRPRPWFRFGPMMLGGPGLLRSLSSFISSDPRYGLESGFVDQAISGALHLIPAALRRKLISRAYRIRYQTRPAG